MTNIARDSIFSMEFHVAAPDCFLQGMAEVEPDPLNVGCTATILSEHDKHVVKAVPLKWFDKYFHLEGDNTSQLYNVPGYMKACVKLGVGSEEEKMAMMGFIRTGTMDETRQNVHRVICTWTDHYLYQFLGLAGLLVRETEGRSGVIDAHVTEEEMVTVAIECMRVARLEKPWGYYFTYHDMQKLHHFTDKFLCKSYGYPKCRFKSHEAVKDFVKSEFGCLKKVWE